MIGLVIMGLGAVYIVTKDDRRNEVEDKLQSENDDESTEGKI
ncbi:MAG: hypothetical protein ACOC8Y_02690 [Candidatus Natronoplasma sp.]